MQFFTNLYFGSKLQKEVNNLSYKNVQYGRTRVRRNYASVQTNVELPNLIEIQTKSFAWFMDEELRALFKEISPIKDHGDGEKFELHFMEHYFEEPKYSIKEAKLHKVNYSRSLKVHVALENKETGEFKDDTVFMGELPIMTPWGTFIFNGSERVVVTQIVRSAGVFFSEEVDKKSGQSIFSGQIIPTRGAWIEFEKSNKNIWFAKLDRSKKVCLPTFIRALGVKSNLEMVNLFLGEKGEEDLRPKNILEIFQNSFDKDESFGEDDAVKKLYDNLRPGEKTSADTARKFIASRLFEVRRYDLAKVGRYKVNKKLDAVARAIGHRLANDLVNPNTGEIILSKGTEITHRKDPQTGKSTADILNENREAFRKTYEYELMLQGDSVVLETLDILVKTNEGDVCVRILGNDQREDRCHIVLSDIFATISYYINLHAGVGKVVGKIDDIDHLSNRRLRLIGELLQNQFRMGMVKVEKNIRDRMSTSAEVKSVTAQNLVNIRPLTSTFREFFGSSKLSQFMDQINPLSELTHKRRLSALGQGGISRDRAGFEVRDVHSSHC